MLGEVQDDWCLGGADLDACRDPGTGAIADWAAEVVDILATYCELSPSGGGLHLLFAYRAGDLPALRGAMGSEWKQTWKRPAGPAEKDPAIELHLGRGFLTVTGHHVAGTPPWIRRVPPDALLWLIRDAGPRFKRRDARSTSAGSPAAAPGAGYLRLKPAELVRLATTLTDPELQLALAFAGHSGRQRSVLCRAMLPHARALRLPGRNAGSTRGAAALAAAKKGLVRRRMIRLLCPSARPRAEDVPGTVAAYDLCFLHTRDPERVPSPKVRWNRLAVRGAAWSLRPDELRVLVLLLGRHGAAASPDPFRISTREVGRTLGVEETRVGRALAGLAQKAWLEVSLPAARRRCGSYRLGDWNGSEPGALPPPHHPGTP
jgi:hypothetical protein